MTFDPQPPALTHLSRVCAAAALSIRPAASAPPKGIANRADLLRRKPLPALPSTTTALPPRPQSVAGLGGIDNAAFTVQNPLQALNKTSDRAST